jgi:decaprenylphospho-beta-D-ribofuranose 2-oxidase
MKVIKHQGWGRTKKTISKCYAPNELNSNIIRSTCNGLPIGLGRSYGDSSINSTGVYYSMADKKKIEINALTKTAKCEAGATIGDLERTAIRFGLFPPTVPGTEHVTIGGAIASNIHGKSHHIAGSFGNSVVDLKLATSTEEVLNLSPTGPTSKDFWATVGGMGLTGIITEATIQLKEVETAYIKVEEKRANNLTDLMNWLIEFDKKYLYTVAWIDLSGKFLGRGKVLGGNHATQVELPDKFLKNPLSIDKPKNLKFPNVFFVNFINTFTVSIFNKIWFKKPLKNGIYKSRSFFHPLDSFTGWNRLYGSHGLIQYQFKVSFENQSFLSEVLVCLKKAKIKSALGVLKILGNTDKSMLGFASPGWTLAFDVSANSKNIENLLSQLNQKLCLLGGKVYLTKDSSLEEHFFDLMYPAKNEWKDVKLKLDPLNYWQSDQGRRLGLC